MPPCHSLQHQAFFSRFGRYPTKKVAGMRSQVFTKVPFEYEIGMRVIVRVDHITPDGWQGAIIQESGLTSGGFSWGEQPSLPAMSFSAWLTSGGFSWGEQPDYPITLLFDKVTGVVTVIEK